MSTAGYPDRDRTLATARRVYYWPTMCVDIDRYVAQCISCTKHKGTTTGPAPILKYPLSECPWNTDSTDLWNLSRSQLNSQFLLVCVNHLSRFVTLALIRNKTAASIVHALVTYLLCSYTTPRILLSTKEYKGRADSNSPGGPYKAACVANLRLLFLHVKGKG